MPRRGLPLISCLAHACVWKISSVCAFCAKALPSWCTQRGVQKGFGPRVRSVRPAVGLASPSHLATAHREQRCNLARRSQCRSNNMIVRDRTRENS
eukprot:13388832-Alexandrium_andersonii.AAC.1